jgi:hypothetical protein
LTAKLTIRIDVAAHAVMMDWRPNQRAMSGD